MTSELTTQQLDEIETRAAHLTEYATLTDKPLQADADQLTGEDVPALIAEVRRLRSELAEQQAETEKLIRWHREDEAAMKRMRGSIERLREEKRALGELAARRESELIALRPRVAELEQDAARLNALYAAGVDNWEGYDDALERL